MGLTLARRAVLIDMAYQLGGRGLAGFHHLLDAIRIGDWNKARDELDSSLLRSQTPNRVVENMGILLSGHFPTGVDSVEALIQKHEGCILAAKPDAKGCWVIGWGHDIPAPEGPIPACTQEVADGWFEQDVELAKLRAVAALGPDNW